MRYILNTYSISEFGNRKDSNGNPHQEDSIYPAAANLSPADRLFILCDGMGGHEAGEIASSTVCETMGGYIGKFDPQGAFTDQNFLNALDSAYHALDAKDNAQTKKKMGTTMTMLKFHDRGATIAHIGDSRVYQFRPADTAEQTQIVFKTQDHSLINDLIKAGELTEEEARNSNKKNVITRAMQPGDERRSKADLHHTVDIQPGDWFYLCSDGMLEEANDDNLRYIFSNASFRTGEQKRQALLENSKFNDDNHTAIIVEVADVIDPLPLDALDAPQPLEAIIDDADIVEVGQSAGNFIGAAQMRPVNPIIKKEKNNNMLWAILGTMIVILVAILCYIFIVLPANKPADAQQEEEELYENTEIRQPQPATDISNEGPAGSTIKRNPDNPIPENVRTTARERKQQKGSTAKPTPKPTTKPASGSAESTTTTNPPKRETPPTNTGTTPTVTKRTTDGV